MANKTKKQHKQCRKKTVKKSHISEIKKLNSNYDDFIKHNLSKSFQNTLVKEFKNRNILDYSTVPTKNNKYSYTYTIKKMIIMEYTIIPAMKLIKHAFL